MTMLALNIISKGYFGNALSQMIVFAPCTIIVVIELSDQYLQEIRKEFGNFLLYLVSLCCLFKMSLLIMKVIIASGKPKPSLLANLLNKFQASHRSRYILTQQIPIHNMQYKRIKHISCFLQFVYEKARSAFLFVLVRY